MKALALAFNYENTLVGTFSVIVILRSFVSSSRGQRDVVIAGVEMLVFCARVGGFKVIGILHC